MSTDVITIEPPTPATAAVIWLHGLGADGNDFVPVVPELGLPSDHSIRFIFPHAPTRKITINAGMSMRGWYDIFSLDKLSHEDEAGIRQSQSIVEGYIAQQTARGIACNRIVIAGFSQGGAIALHTALRYPVALAGVMALSTYLPLAGSLHAERSAGNAQTPILMCHGQADPVLPIGLGETSRDALVQAGYKPDWHSYPMAHQVCAQEIAVIGDWLRARLS